MSSPNFVPTSWSERKRLIRFRMQREQLHFADEFRLVPRWLVWLVVFLYAAALFIFVTANRMGALNDGAVWPSGADSLEGALAVIGVVTAIALPTAFFILLTGYVYEDARRRDMNAMLWTLLVIFLFPAWIFIGYVLYFLVRDPLPYHCTQCGTLVNPRYNFCPRCHYNLRPACPRCQREVGERDQYCPYCGLEVANAAAPQVAAPGAPDMDRTLGRSG